MLFQVIVLCEGGIEHYDIGVGNLISNTAGIDPHFHKNHREKRISQWNWWAMNFWEN